jgi:pimeloyl-ACP methyl ester carboxylesterase
VAKAVGEPLLLVGHSSGAVVAAGRPGRAIAILLRDLAQLGARLDTYARIDVPVVLLGGDRSPAHLGERLDALARALPRAEPVVLHGQGHNANLGTPDQVARVLETLADRLPR